MNKNKVLSIFEKIIFSVVLIGVITVIVLSIIALPKAPVQSTVVGKIEKTQSDYTLILVMAIPSLIALFLPTFLKKKFHIEMPLIINIIYDLFFFCAVVLGEYFSFYYRFSGWDNMLHFTSAVLITFVSFSIVSSCIGEEKIKKHPWMLFFFSLCIAEFSGIMWELCEFTMDSFGLNSQKFQDANGVDLVGRLALMDTMGDIIVNSLGAITAGTIGYVSLKHDQVFYESVLIRKVEGELEYDNYASSGSVWARK